MTTSPAMQFVKGPTGQPLMHTVNHGNLLPYLPDIKQIWKYFTPAANQA